MSANARHAPESLTCSSLGRPVAEHGTRRRGGADVWRARSRHGDPPRRLRFLSEYGIGSQDATGASVAAAKENAPTVESVGTRCLPREATSLPRVRSFSKSSAKVAGATRARKGASAVRTRAVQVGGSVTLVGVGCFLSPGRLRLPGTRRRMAGRRREPGRFVGTRGFRLIRTKERGDATNHWAPDRFVRRRHARDRRGAVIGGGPRARAPTRSAPSGDERIGRRATASTRWRR